MNPRARTTVPLPDAALPALDVNCNAMERSFNTSARNCEPVSRPIRSRDDCAVTPAWWLGTVSDESIYTALYAIPRGELRRELLACLHQGHKERWPRSRGTTRKGKTFPDALSIHLRPPCIEERLLPGHWEGDFIKGKLNGSAVGTLVERTSRLLLLARMPDCGAASALAGFATFLGQVPGKLRQSLTYDRGTEMARYAELAERTSMNIYFADPYSPWQRGSNENSNGLVRQYLPKGMDLSAVHRMS
jgi:transposase, IS30 family